MNASQKPSPPDHRRLGRELKLFHFDDDIGKGLPLWLPRGAIIRHELEKLMHEIEFRAGYEIVSSPHLARERLFEQSGHIPYFAENMYPAMKVDDGEIYRLRPMNCPHHHRIFSAEPRSYRDLPVRFAEQGQVYRLEESGALSGLSRVRGLCINDAHIYCAREQAAAEFMRVLHMHLEVYQLFDIRDVQFRLSLHGKGDKYVDDPASWAWSEKLLRESLVKSGLPFVESENEAAFYGPKIDVQVRGASGREETFSTVQLDFASAARMDLFYIGADGEKHRPVIIHRAPLGSYERLIAFLLERADGRLPSWLAPIQIRVLAIGEAPAQEAAAWVSKLRARLIRAEVDARPESLSRRLRDAFHDRVANVIVLGAKEFAGKDIMLRARDAIRLMKMEDFERELERKISVRENDV